MRRRIQLALCSVAVVAIGACGGGGSSTGEGPITSYSLSTSVSGLTGSGLTLSVNDGTPVAISSNGTVTLSSGLSNGSTYSVTVASQPSQPVQVCAVTNGSGTVNGSNVSNLGVSCTTASNSAQTATLTQADSALPNSATSSVVQVVTPSGAGQLGGWVPMDLSGSLGETIAFAVDANGNIIMAAIVSSEKTTFSADSTALAFVRLLIANVATTQTAADIDAVIAGASGYQALVTSIGSDLQAGIAPSTDAAVADNLVGLVTVVVPKIAAMARKVAIKAFAPTLANGVPFTIIGSGESALTVQNGGFRQIEAVNSTPVPWTVSSSAGGGSTAVLDGSSTLLAMNNAEFTVSAQFDEASKSALDYEIGLGILQTIIPFLPTSTCDENAMKIALKSLIATIPATPSQGYDGFWTSLRAVFTPQNFLTLAGKCSKISDISPVFQSVSKFFSFISKAKAAVQATGILGQAAYADLHWDDLPVTVGFCATFDWKIQSCATQFSFSPASFLMAPGAIASATVSAMGTSAPAAVPGNLVFQTSDPTVAAFTAAPGASKASPGTGDITIQAGSNIASSPATISVSDPITQAASLAPLSVKVIQPIITPAVQSVAVPDATAPDTRVSFKLTDGQGNDVLVPQVTWNPDTGTSNIIPNQTTGQIATFYIPSTASPGTVIPITAYDPNGVPYGQAAQLIIGGPGTCIPPQGATACSVTLYDIPDSTHSGFVAPMPGTITTVQTSNGATTTVVNNQNPLGVTLYDNVNGPPLTTPPCLQNPNGTPGCPPLNYHHFELCSVDNKWMPIAYHSVVSFQVPLLSNSGCTGQAEEDDIITGYSLAADGTLTGTDDSTASANYTCTTTSFGLTTVSTTKIQNAKQDVIVMNLKDGSGNATVSENRSESISGSGGFTETTTVSGSQSWAAESNSPPQFTNTGITASTTDVPAGQALPQACTVGIP